MADPSQSQGAESKSRRDFLKTGAAAVAGTVAMGLNRSVYAGSDETLRVALVGCGNRGSGAARQALSADPQTKLVAVADAFPDRLQNCLSGMREKYGKQMDVPPERQFVGLDAYKPAIAEADVVLLATPPFFRPAHLKAAVDAGKHVFCEKPVAVDGPGTQSVFETIERARQKSLSIVSGLCWRYHRAITETFDRVHSGAIGEIVAMQCSYLTNGLWSVERDEQMSDLHWHLRNWLYFTWLSGDHIVEQHVHSLDKLVWAMGDAAPVSATGVGGRQVRTDQRFGHIYDHFAISYEFANGVTAFGRCRQQDGAQVDVTDQLFGTKGSCHIASSRPMIKSDNNWRYTGPPSDMYQAEHDALFKSIRDGKPINNGDYMTKSTMMAVMGRMAAYTGQTVTWKQALNSKENLTPDGYREDLTAPTYNLGVEMPKVAMPGITRVV